MANILTIQAWRAGVLVQMFVLVAVIVSVCTLCVSVLTLALESFIFQSVKIYLYSVNVFISI